MFGASEKDRQKEIALVSLGMSCQTAHQLRFNQPYLEDFGIGPEAIPSNYFDWLICPPDSAARLLADGLPRFERGDIVLKSQPFWEAYQFYFWHEFRHHEIIDIDAHFEIGQQKFDYLRERFSRLHLYRRLIFVLSNIQGNLPEVHAETGALDFMLDDQRIQALRSVVQSYLGRSVEFLVITSKGRFEGPVGSGYEIAFFAEDTSEWKGDKVAWRTCLQQYFTKFPISGTGVSAQKDDYG
ncbi:MAG: hypothetical protein ABJN26_10655 [Stappiaceae bacterium]